MFRFFSLGMYICLKSLVMIYSIIFSLLSLFGPFTGLESNQEIYGYWKTTDDVTGEEIAVVKIYNDGEEIKGEIIELLAGATMTHCTKCEGEEKNLPLEGLTFMKGFKKDGLEWNGGTIFDPKSGKLYKGRIWFEPNSGGLTLKVRNTWLMMYNTQTWHRVR